MVSRIDRKKWLVMLLVMATTITAQAQEVYRLETETPAVHLRSNTLYDLALSPNIGLEIQTDMGIAWQLDYVGAWWNNDAKHRYFSNYGLQTELRYYLASRKQEFPYKGHHAGIYLQMATYDFEFGGTGYQCPNLEDSYGFGLSYGYAKAISRRFSLDFTIGIGYFKSSYTQYVPNNDWYKATHWKRLTWVGPTKVEVSLVWNLNKNN